MEKIDLLITLTHDEDNENNVTLAFQMGMMALSKGHKVAITLLSHAVALAKKGYGEKIDIGAPFKPVGELIPAFLREGGKLKVCSACMEHNGVKAEDLYEEAEIIKADDVIELLMTSEKSLQLN